MSPRRKRREKNAEIPVSSPDDNSNDGSHEVEGDINGGRRKSSVARATLNALGLYDDLTLTKMRLKQRQRADSMQNGHSSRETKVNEIVHILEDTMEEDVDQIDDRFNKSDIDTLNNMFKNDMKYYRLGKPDTESMDGFKTPQNTPSQNQLIKERTMTERVNFRNQTTSVSDNRDILMTKSRDKSFESILSLPELTQLIEEKALSKSEIRAAWSKFENFVDSEDISPAGLNRRKYLSNYQIKKPLLPIRWDSGSITTPFSDKIIQKFDSNRSKVNIKSQMTEVAASAQGSQTGRAIEEEDMGEFNLFFKLILKDEIVDYDEDPGHIPEKFHSDNFITGVAARDQYETYRRAEQDVVNAHMAEEKFLLKMQLIDKKKDYEGALQLAQEHFCSDYGVTGKLRDKFVRPGDTATITEEARQRGGSVAGIRNQIEGITQYRPWFLYLISAIQAIMIAALCFVTGIQTPIAIKVKDAESLQDTWAGRSVTVTKEVAPNIWIGPPKFGLVRAGSIFAPCMRRDQHTTLRNAAYTNAQRAGLGCCEVIGYGAGTTTESECENVVTTNNYPNYVWRNITCAQRDPSTISGGFEGHLYKPCCYGTNGDCTLTTFPHCKFLDGLWNQNNLEHCSQAHCDGEICRLSFTKSDNAHYQRTFTLENRDLSEEIGGHSHNQQWRILLSLFYHHGIFHALIVVIVQCVLGVDTERVAGWLRIGSIYILSGLSGLMVAAIARPFHPHVGGLPACAGLLAVHCVELANTWRLMTVIKPALIKLGIVNTVIIITSIVPSVGIAGSLAGFFVGGLMAVIVIPYVTFDHIYARARVILVITSIILLVLTLTTIMFLFYTIQPHNEASLAEAVCSVPYGCDDG